MSEAISIEADLVINFKEFADILVGLIVNPVWDLALKAVKTLLASTEEKKPICLKLVRTFSRIFTVFDMFSLSAKKTCNKSRFW